jgi:hypothetical protein
MKILLLAVSAICPNPHEIRAGTVSRGSYPQSYPQKMWTVLKRLINPSLSADGGILATLDLFSVILGLAARCLTFRCRYARCFPAV